MLEQILIGRSLNKIETKGKSSHAAQPHIFYMQIVKAAILVYEQYFSLHSLKPHCHSLALPSLPFPLPEWSSELKAQKGEKPQAKNNFLETAMK